MIRDRNDFRENGKLRVRWFGAEERKTLLETVGAVGIPVEDMIGGEYMYSPTDTNTYEVNIKERTLHRIGQPFIDTAMCCSGIRFYSVSEFCRLAELEFTILPRFPLWHIPHDGQRLPAELLSSVCIPRERFEEYHEKMRDADVLQLIPRACAYRSAVESFDISRLLCDVERFIGPGEPMEKYGMGFCYERAYDGTRIKNVSEALKERTLRYYNAHHRRMNEKCGEHPGVLLFDMHSYSDEIVPSDLLTRGKPTPDICIGTDPRFTPPHLIRSVRRRFEEAGFTTEQNYPYSGCYVPASAISGESDCLSVMLEFNRRVYLNEDGKPDGDRTAGIRRILERIIADCVDIDGGQRNP